MRIKWTFLLLMLTTISLNAQWSLLHTNIEMKQLSKTNATIKNAAIFSLSALEIDKLKALKPQSLDKIATSGIQFDIPLPDGSFYKAVLHNTPIFHPELSAKYPDIYSFTGFAKEEVGAIVKCDISPDGFHAMILSPSLGTIFVDPVNEMGVIQYVSYHKEDYASATKKDFKCLIDQNEVSPNSSNKNRQIATPDCTLRKYRLALSCTGEYAAFQGGTKAKVLAAMNTTMTRVSGVYQRDFSVVFQLIANNDKIIFLNANTDPFTNNDGGKMLGENQKTVDSLIGTNNYDIGHVFSTGGGGIASLYSVCNSGNKAQGVTGSGSPVGDPFDIDYVAHEMGHQFNANHSFNNDCSGNISPSTAFEPGSGSTIMAYAGVCDPNVQFNSDDYFHKISLDEISTYVTVLAGNNCPEKTILNNHAPIVDAGKDQIIPMNTAFELTASGSDIDGDTLTYCWEQMDNELVISPPQASYSNGPSFRSFKPLKDATRVFPQISTIVNNSTSIWEVLPGVSRKLNFSVSARDNHNAGGCFATDQLKLTVDGGSGPFLVMAPNTPITWFVGDTQTVSWKVAKTDIAPINCKFVDIYLSVDGGFTYPYLLEKSVPNTGSYQIQVPNHTGIKCRIKVKGSNNVFFDISNSNFTIKPPLTPNYFITSDKVEASICSLQDTQLSFLVNIVPLAGFNDTVSISVLNLPAGMTAVIDPGQTILPKDVAIHFSDFQNVTSGLYKIDILVKSNTISKIISFNLSISSGFPEKVVPTNVANHSKNIAVSPKLVWQPIAGAQSFHLSVSKDPLFKTIVYEGDIADTSFTLSSLDYYTVYFWRVHANNACGKGADSETMDFQTINTACFSFEQNTPITIPDNKEFDGTSILSIQDSFLLTDLHASVTLNHSYISDIKLVLIGPDDESIVLFNNTCDDMDDIDAIFQDNGSNQICSPTPPAVGGTVKPAVGFFNQWKGKNIKGNWKLNVTDNYPEDGGMLQHWSLTGCREDTAYSTPLLAKNNILYVQESMTQKIDSNYVLTISGNQTASKIRYIVEQIPQYGQLRKGSSVLNVGDSFTQSDINQQIINYKNNVFGSGRDSVNFYIVDIAGNWLPNQTLQIVIYKPLVINETHIDNLCFGDSTAQINITADFGVPNYQYSKDSGATYQISGLFTMLKSGTYNIQIKDSIDKVLKKVVVISQPDSLVLKANVMGATVSLMISGGTSPYKTSIDGIHFLENIVLYDSLQNGIYMFYVEDANGCSTSSSATIKGVSTTSLNQDHLIIFPNPTNETLHIRSSQAIISIQLIDIMGKTIDVSTIGNKSLGQFSMSTAEVPSGIYFLKLKTKTGYFTEKIIIHH